MDQTNQANQERVIVTIGGVDYYADSFPEKERIAVVQIDQIDRDIQKKKEDIRNLEYARQFLFEFLAKNVDQYEKVPEQANNTNNTDNSGGDAA